MLELRHISKSFPGVKALDDVSLQFGAGRIHGLIGENGAGKSTAIRIITGLEQPDQGEVWLDGKQVTFRNRQESRRHGVGIVHQELQLIPDATIAENIMIDHLTTRRWGVIDWPAVNREATRHLERVGLDVPPDRIVRGLSAARQQMVQIAQALSGDVKVLLLDEPTSSLTEHEARRLFTLLRELRDRGLAIVFVTHKLDEIVALCDTATVLRDGRLAGVHSDAARATTRELVDLMIGRECNDDHLGELSPDWSDPVLQAEHLVRHERANDVSFTLHRGEILGFYGLIGSGRTEVARILIGEDRLDSGRVLIHGREVSIPSVQESLYRHRLGYVTENRKQEGLMLDDSVETNLTVAIWPRLQHALTRRIDRREEETVAQGYVDAMGIKTPSLAHRTRHLSGGNQQKVSIGKWLAADCEILIIDEPTVGVDVGAKQQIHRLIWDLAASGGKSVILISSDLPELVRMVNRLLVFRERRIVGEVRDIDTARKSYAEIRREIAPCFS